MANFVSQKHTGQDFEKALDIKSVFNTITTNVAVYLDGLDGATTTFTGVMWSVAPTNNNTTYGFGFHPTTGRPYLIKSTNNVVTGEILTSGTASAISSIPTDGSHSHTVNISSDKVVTDVTLDTTKYAWTIDKGNNNANVETVVKSYPGTTSNLVKGSIWGVKTKTENNTVVADTASASSVSAGAAVAAAKRAASQTTVGNADVGQEITCAKAAASATTVGNANYDSTGTTVGSAGALTITDGAAQNPANKDLFYVDHSGANDNTKISFKIAAVEVKSTTIHEAVASETTIIGCNGTETFRPAVATTNSSTKIYGCDADNTVDVIPYTITAVTGLAKAASSSSSFATGSLDDNGAGASVMTGLGTANTADVLTDDATISVSENNSGLALGTGISKTRDAVNNAGSTSTTGSHNHTPSA